MSTGYLWAAGQAPLSTGVSRHGYRRGLPRLLQGIFPSQGLNPHLLRLLPCGRVLYHRATGEARTAGGCRC